MPISRDKYKPAELTRLIFFWSSLPTNLDKTIINAAPTLKSRLIQNKRIGAAKLTAASSSFPSFPIK